MASFKDSIRLPSAKFPEIGATVEGVVLSMADVPVPTFDKNGRPTGVQAVDEDDNPIFQIDVLLDTAAGKVTLHTSGAIASAIGRALGEIGADDLDEGDSLQVTYTGDGKKQTGRNAPKQYSATIVKA